MSKLSNNPRTKKYLPVAEPGTETDVKFFVLLSGLLKELQSPEYQNEYTYELRIKTLRIFADSMEDAVTE